MKLRYTDRAKDDIDDAMAHLERESKQLRRDIKKFQSKVSRSIKKFKI